MGPHEMGHKGSSPGDAAGSYGPLVQSIHEAGPAVIGGVETTRYEATVDVQALDKALGNDSGSDLSPAGPLQIWVDSQARVRQLQISYTVPQEGQITETEDFTDFGVPVHIAIPPAQHRTRDSWYRSVTTRKTHSSAERSSGPWQTRLVIGA